MHYEPQFRIALGAILLAAFAVRLYGHSQTLRAGKIRWIEGKLNITLRIVAGLVGIAALWTYLIWPEWILWASVPLPAWLRWTGAATAGDGVTHTGSWPARSGTDTDKRLAWFGSRLSRTVAG